MNHLASFVSNLPHGVGMLNTYIFNISELINITRVSQLLRKLCICYPIRWIFLAYLVISFTTPNYLRTSSLSVLKSVLYCVGHAVVFNTRLYCITRSVTVLLGQ